jgi:uncharacterized protein
MLERQITPRLLSALQDTPVVMLHGARQTGKSTLVRHLAAHGHPARYLTLDDAVLLAAVEADPAGFLAGLEGAAVIDEVQRAPELFRALKAQVDQDRRPGRFLLTGSAQVLLLPQAAEALAGRMEVLTLWPLAQEEILGQRPGVVDRLYAPQWQWSTGGASRADVLQLALRGGYPEVLQRPTAARRAAWFNSYLTTILQRDVRDLAQIEGLTALPRLLQLLAARAGGLLNVAELSRGSGLPQTTLKRYLALLEMTFLVHLVPPWSGSLSRRLVRSPKVYLSDSGLLGHLLGLDERSLPLASPLWGQLLESFVVMELQRQSTWSEAQPQLLHFRTHAGQEVDVVMEDRAGRVVGLEIKASATVGAQDFRGLRALADTVGDRFHRGLVIYTGQEVVPFSPRFWAAPVAGLWQA